MAAAIEEYFALEPQCPTVTGLAVHLGFTSRQALNNYEGYGEDFLWVVKRAKLKIESCYERRAVYGETCAAGAILGLKNFGWKDNQSVAMGALPPIIVMSNGDGPERPPNQGMS